jgi:alpha-tubulin suppressor-like RCC1 family protein
VVLVAAFSMSVVLTMLMATSTMSGCLGPGIFRCEEDRQCGDGVCESTGACSLPDGSCDSGRRYRAHAPAELANRCVDEACPTNPVVHLRAGGDHACVVRQDGGVACWGEGASGQLGDDAGLARSTMVPVPGLPVRALDVALGDAHSCALLVDGSVWCWGANTTGQLGDGTTVSRAQPAPVVALDDAVAVAAGGAFSCALRADGSVTCWGSNATGQLGGGAGAAGGADALTPVAIDAAVLHDVRLLAASDRHACAATTAGAVMCWGSNAQGELGDGTFVDRSTPAPAVILGAPGALGAAGPITTLAAGVGHTCLLAGGQVSCWGTNLLGELGDGNDLPVRPSAGLVPVLAAVSDLAAAGHHTCARLEDGTAWCWGANQSGQLGDGTTTNIGVPVPVTGLPDVEAVATGSSFSCARRRDGSVWCWGDDRAGQLGTGARLTRDVPTPALGQSGVLSGILALSAGSNHTCARRSVDGAASASGAASSPSSGPASVLCWGSNQAGQLGDGTRTDRAIAAPLKVALDARELVAGALHTCARTGGDGATADGAVWCWGRGSSGQLGAAMPVDYVSPVRALGVIAATRIGAGGAHTCAAGAAGAVCWGDNQSGQLGDGTTDKRTTPTALVGIAGIVGADVVAWALGAAHSCVLLASGQVKCWGRGTDGQLGDGRMASSPTPVAVAGLDHATAIAAGDDHTCAATSAGAVWCWGQGTSGQLGWGAALARAVPVPVMGVADAVDVTAGGLHTCARVDSAATHDPRLPGSVYCWGDNRLGQLGDGTRDGQLRAPAAPVVTDSLAVAAGGTHTCSLRAEGTVVCWGSDATGQLGDGRDLQLATPHLARLTCP